MDAREFLDKIYGTKDVDGSEFNIPLDSVAHYMEIFKKNEETSLSNNIDNVTVNNLDLALRMNGISFDKNTIDLIIDLVELIEEKGDNTSIKDICDLNKLRDGKQ